MAANTRARSNSQHYSTSWQWIGAWMLLHQVIKGSLRGHAVLSHKPGQAYQG